MLKLVIVEDGQETEVHAAEGRTIMEVIRETATTELLALCGGCCSCGTCHIFVQADRLDQLPPISGDEDALLDTSEYRRPGSRLSCQLSLTRELDGLRIEIAPQG